MWSNVADLIEPFANGSDGFQWLADVPGRCGVIAIRVRTVVILFRLQGEVLRLRALHDRVGQRRFRVVFGGDHLFGTSRSPASPCLRRRRSIHPEDFHSLFSKRHRDAVLAINDSRIVRLRLAVDRDKADEAAIDRLPVERDCARDGAVRRAAFAPPTSIRAKSTEYRIYQSLPRESLPLMVLAACQVASEIESETKRVLPSQMATLTPPVCRLRAVK